MYSRIHLNLQSVREEWRQYHAPAALITRTLTATHCTSDWVFPTASPDGCREEEISYPTGVLTPNHLPSSNSRYRLSSGPPLKQEDASQNWLNPLAWQLTVRVYCRTPAAFKTSDYSSKGIMGKKARKKKTDAATQKRQFRSLQTDEHTKTEVKRVTFFLKVHFFPPLRPRVCAAVPLHALCICYTCDYRLSWSKNFREREREESWVQQRPNSGFWILSISFHLHSHYYCVAIAVFGTHRK
jgi:hypothetical protein